ncbi:MAG TPA: glycoside hydrolase family 57 protein [Verrucomicrobiae bacterium]|nr:glycoside hydrolase family 57 protein [Verrucomicrobiae bacterium]
MPLHVAFLWHMHQPYYVDPVHRTALMPWVRLHATKGYLDMIWLVDQFPEFHCTFNMTPVLVKQIQELANGEVRDLWHDLAVPAPEVLTPVQRAGLLEHFFKANVDNMVKPYPRYWALLQKRGLRTAKVNLEQVAAGFTDEELRDLQVWFNLTWFGYAAERLYPEIAELKRKGRGFSEDDKQAVFNQQHRILTTVLGDYKRLADRGQIELSTTPFFHPILPLVYNTEFARRCMPGRDLPPPFSRPEDVKAQLAMARDSHAQVFGVPPKGIWPSEGSVCPELIPILQELGYQWFATDEENLWRSLAGAHSSGGPGRAALFQGYRAQFGDAGACLAFRERGLSDFIGFTAARNEAPRAADFMVGQLEEIGRTTGADSKAALCAVILDGENAWENFADGGQEFLRELYRRLSSHPLIRPTTFHNYFTAHPPTAILSTLHTGSWIHADFDIWIGDPEENRAWELLGQTRDFLQALVDRGGITAERRLKALQEIYAAEGSDWFWWYGGDFVTENDVIFDELFRTHLQNVYRIAGAPIPEALKTSICRGEITREITQPTGLITPKIDGLVTSYYEWTGAGVYEAGRNLVAMYQSERCVDAIQFGADLGNFYLRIDFRKGVELPQQAALRVNFVDPTQRAVVVPKLARPVTRAELWVTHPDSARRKLADVMSIRFDQILELGVPLTDLGWKKREPASFFVQLLDREVELERHPDVGTLSLTVPDDVFAAENWWV